MTDLKLKIIDKLENGDYISGSTLSEELGCTRSYISKAIGELNDMGFEIESSKGSGYRMIHAEDVLDKNKIIENLHTKKIARQLELFDSIDSTNNYAKELASKGVAGDGFVVISDCQTGGKGRLGRTFVSPRLSGLYYSFVLKGKLNIETCSLITAAAAVAVADTIDEICNVETKIKWVNDIYLNGKKICGILTEGQVGIENKQLDYAVCGIGINILEPREKFSENLENIATNIEKETGKRFERNLIAAKLSDNLEYQLDNLDKKLFLEKYRSKSNLIGRDVIIHYNNSDRDAHVLGIDENAELIVEFSNGETLHLNSGEARIIKNGLLV